MKEEVTTEFNSNLATLERVDRLLRFCGFCDIQEDINQWYRQLRVLRREAMVKMKHDAKKGVCSKTCLKCVTIAKFEKLTKTYESFKYLKNDEALKKKFERELDEFELILRQFMNDKGMLLRDGKTGMEKFQYG